MEGLDAECKLLLSSREILAVILKETVSEYREYSREEIIGFIEPDCIESDREVSPGRTNSQLQGGNQEFVSLNEKVSRFDVRFKAKNPVLSGEEIVIKLYIDNLLRFLNTIMYPQGDDFMEVVSESQAGSREKAETAGEPGHLGLPGRFYTSRQNNERRMLQHCQRLSGDAGGSL